MDDDPEFLEQLGRRIAAFRRAARLTQAKLAERVELETSYISHIEGGDRQPSIGALRRIATAVKVLPGRLIDGNDRLTHDEKVWDAAARGLAANVRGLHADDLLALSYLAGRLKLAAMARLPASTIAAAVAAESRTAPQARGPRTPTPRRYKARRRYHKHRL